MFGVYIDKTTKKIKVFSTQGGIMDSTIVLSKL
jgi:hypothetical protein